MRGRFALVGAGVILLAVGCVATAQDTWLDWYGIIAYFLVPLAFIPLAAVFLASPRANRFVESVFTAPVERRDWLTAKSASRKYFRRSRISQFLDSFWLADNPRTWFRSLVHKGVSQN